MGPQGRRGGQKGGEHSLEWGTLPTASIGSSRVRSIQSRTWHKGRTKRWRISLSLYLFLRFSLRESFQVLPRFATIRFCGNVRQGFNASLSSISLFFPRLPFSLRTIFSVYNYVAVCCEIRPSNLATSTSLIKWLIKRRSIYATVRNRVLELFGSENKQIDTGRMMFERIKMT